MQNCMKRIFSVMLLLALVLSCVPAVALAAENTVAENTTAGESFADLNQAIASALPGEIVKVLSDATGVVYGNEGVILDLNGHNVDATVAEGVTLSAIDSATDDYEGSFGTLTTDGKVAATVKTAEPKSYVTVCDNGTYSFHRYYAAIAAISLKPATAALGYRAEFRGDETVKNAVVEYGYELWVNDNAHKTFSRTDKLEKTSLTLRLNKLLQEGNDSLNAIGSTATVGGNAYMTLNVGGEQIKLTGTEQKTTLRQVIESINANVSSYGEAQLETVRALCTTYAPWMMGWATDAIFGNGEGEGNGDLKVEITVDVNAENNVLSQDATLSHGGVSATVPQGTVLENGTTQLVLTITQKASSDSDVTEGEGETLIPLDVHIAGISENNTTPIIICLGNVLPKGLNIGNYDLHHVEDGKTVAMTRVYTIAELDAHNEFHYDPATGAVTVAMASFSEIALRSVATGTWEGSSQAPVQDGDTYYIYNADQLRGFAEMVGGMNGYTADSFAGKTVILHADIDLNDLTDSNNYVFYPIGYYNSTKSYNKVSGGTVSSSVSSFEGTFDGNGHTISNFYQNTWEMFGDYNNGYSGTPNHYKDAMGLFGYVVNGTIKNLTVKNFSSDGEFTPTGVIAAYACNSTFENISITNCNPRVYNTGNGGIVGIGGNDSDPDTYKLTFNNITIDNTNTITALWGSWDVACGGLVGMFRGAGHAYMTNCHVAAQIDVYNDVCGNYQYYWYRYAGMMIGTNKNMVTDANGYTVPETTKYHAEGCTVHFGTWNDYYYCELVANSLASYTHDHQFSRLTPVDAITEGMPNGHYVYFENGEAKCHHIVNNQVWNHEDAGEETVNGETVLKEDKQCVYLPFNQLFTGYGWGVKHIPVYNGEDYAFKGITILDREIADSVVKFDAKVNDGTTYWTGSQVKIGDLFAAKADLAVEITKNVQVSVSPVGTTSTASATYDAATTWTEGTLTFSGKGAAEIIITDYYFCTETRLEVYVDGYTVRYNDPNGITTVLYGEEGITKLPTGAAVEGKTFYGWALAPVDDKSTGAEKIAAPYVPAEHEIFLYATYTYDVTTVGSGDYEKVTTAPADWSGEYLIVYESGKVAFNGGLATLDAVSNTISVTINNNTIASSDATDAATFTIAKYNNGYSILSKSGKYIGRTANSNGINSGSTKIEHSLAMSGTNVTITSSNGYMLKYNNSSGQTRFRYYGSGQQAVALYKKGVGGSETSTYYVSYFTECQEHPNTITDYKAATCIAAGYTTVTCADCGATISTTEIPATGHNFVDGSCSVCGEVKATSATITFDDTAKRTTFNTSQQVWEENGITVTNNSSTNSVADYSNPARFYKNTDLIIEYPEMSRIEIVCSSESYAEDLQGAVSGSTINGTTVIITLSESANSYTITLSVGQVRVNSITVYTSAGESSVCDHVNAETTTTTTEATCTEDGATVVTCNNCGGTMSSTPIPATGHNFVNGVCTACEEDQVIIPEIPETGVYQLVTDIDEITSGGKFVIVANVNGTYYAMGAYDSEKSAVLGEEVEISGDYVTTADAPTWIIGQYGENIALQGAEGAYLKQSSADGAPLSDSKSQAYAWTVLTGNDTNTFYIASAAGTDRGLVYRTGSYNYFRSYKQLDGTPDADYHPELKLYKLVEDKVEECEHSYTSEVTQEATCTETGVKTNTCSKCGDSYTETIAATGHSFVADQETCTNDSCDEVNPDYEAPSTNEPITLATFTLGADNGTEDTNAKSTYTETNGNYTLSITNGTKMYYSVDGSGNGCIRIGSSSAKGSFQFTVDSNVTKVVIYVARYSTDSAKITVNGTQYTLTAEYQAIEVDTTSTKTVTVAAVNASKCRAYINTIEFWGTEN